MKPLLPLHYSGKNRTDRFLPVFLFVLTMLLPVLLPAQPSGGPYGPIQQVYELPDDAGTIYYVATDGKEEASGKKRAEPTTIEAAIERVVTGDAIVMRGGTYRTGNLILNQGITIQPYRDETVIFKGTRVASDWENLRGGLWRTSWSDFFASKPANWWLRRWHGRNTPLHRFNNDMVFVDGKFLQSEGWEGAVDENTYCIDYESGLVYIGTDPTDRLVEITAFNVAIHRITGECHGKPSDGRGIIIRGITFTQYAYRALEIDGTDPEGPSDEADHGKEVTGTTLEHCTLSFCSRVAAYLRGDHMTLRHCRVHDTSTEGIYILSSSDVLLEKNIFSRNNIERITGYYPAAVKIFNQCYRVTCRDNLVTDLPWSNGIWYDVGNVDGVFINNWVENVGDPDRYFQTKYFWPSNSGFFFEISKGAVCAGNVFVNCDQGIYIINASDVKMYQNTLVNSTVCIMRTPRSAEGDHFGWHPATGPGVDERDGHEFVNNLLTADTQYHRPLLALAQTPSLCERLNQPQIGRLDYNTYVRSSDNPETPLIVWSPEKNAACQLSYNSVKAFHKQHSKFAEHSQEFTEYNGPLFKGRELDRYELLKEFPGSGKASRLPENIAKLLGKNIDAGYIGAYPE